jgi:hypothetical protein
MQKVEEENAK